MLLPSSRVKSLCATLDPPVLYISQDKLVTIKAVFPILTGKVIVMGESVANFFKPGSFGRTNRFDAKIVRTSIDWERLFMF
jgi:hypothetical protein